MLVFGSNASRSVTSAMNREPDSPGDVPAFGIDGRAFPIQGSFGIVGTVGGLDGRYLDIKEPMGHLVRLRQSDLERGLGGRENALALIADAKAHADAVTIRFDSTGVSYSNTTQFLRFEKAIGNGETPPFHPTDAQRRVAAKDAERRLQRLINREFPGR